MIETIRDLYDQIRELEESLEQLIELVQNDGTKYEIITTLAQILTDLKDQ